MIVGVGILDESHVITSSYNHFIIMRTHRWPYGPCLQTFVKVEPFPAQNDNSDEINTEKYIS